MHSISFQPAIMPPVVSFLYQNQSPSESRAVLQQVPMNLSAEEIRALVLEVMG